MRPPDNERPRLAGQGEDGASGKSVQSSSYHHERNRLNRDVERLASLGWPLYPASARSKAACFEGATDAATCDLDVLERWSWEYPGCNWRMVCGPAAVWGLDCDVPGPDHAADGVSELRRLVDQHGPLPERPMTRSGGGGFCLFFKHSGEPIIGKTGTPAPGLDPRRARLSVTVPPSRHHRTGQPYRWIIPPWEVTPPPAPAWLLRLVAPPPERPITVRMPVPGTDKARRYACAALKDAVRKVATARNGQRNHVLNVETFALSRFIREGALDADEIAGAMAIAGLQAGLGRLEVEQTLKSALRAGGRR
jgi:Bifunctional DNA primase/polymerase, N-terminal